MQKGDSLFLVSQETTIQHFLFLCHHTGLASCLAPGSVKVVAEGRRGRGRVQFLPPPLPCPYAHHPLSKPQEDVSFPADASAALPILLLQG